MNEKCTNENPCGNCDVCDMEPGDDTCPHGEHHPGDCEICFPPEDEDERYEIEMRSEMDMTCEHGMDEDDCMECGAKYDALADKAREQADWNHFHPTEDE